MSDNYSINKCIVDYEINKHIIDIRTINDKYYLLLLTHDIKDEMEFNDDNIKLVSSNSGTRLIAYLYDEAIKYYNTVCKHRMIDRNIYDYGYEFDNLLEEINNPRMRLRLNSKRRSKIRHRIYQYFDIMLNEYVYVDDLLFMIIDYLVDGAENKYTISKDVIYMDIIDARVYTYNHYSYFDLLRNPFYPFGYY